MNKFNVDALLPDEMARQAEYIGIKKAEAPASKLFFLAILAGSFIAFGAIFATTVATSGDGAVVAFGIKKLLLGLVFSLGLILVIVAGAELFTGNNLIVMAWTSGKITLKAVLRNWGIVYVGNFIGSIAIAFLYFTTQKYMSAGGAVGETMLKIAIGKTTLNFWPALTSAILCNILVCLAVWLTFSARSTGDKIAAIIFPITAFVSSGFEHCIANMYFVPVALFVKIFDPSFAEATHLSQLSELTWKNFVVNNLIPVTIGNIIGGAVFVAGIYWVIFLKDAER